MSKKKIKNKKQTKQKPVFSKERLLVSLIIIFLLLFVYLIQEQTKSIKEINKRLSNLELNAKTGADNVLSRFKIDSLALNVGGNSKLLLINSQQRPDRHCLDIINTEKTKSHNYYYILEAYNALLDYYGPYQNDYSLIEESLDQYYKNISDIENLCNSNGYKLPTLR